MYWAVLRQKYNHETNKDKWMGLTTVFNISVVYQWTSVPVVLFSSPITHFSRILPHANVNYALLFLETESTDSGVQGSYS